MKECYFDPAMQTHKTRMQSIYLEQRRREFIRKHPLLVASIIASAVFMAVWLALAIATALKSAGYIS